MFSIHIKIKKELTEELTFYSLLPNYKLSHTVADLL